MRFATNRRAGLWLVVTALAATAALIAADRPNEQKTNEAPSREAEHSIDQIGTQSDLLAPRAALAQHRREAEQSDNSGRTESQSGEARKNQTRGASVKDGEVRVEVEGVELTEEQERALSKAMKSLLQEAISRAVTNEIERARKQLQISGELEEKLFAYPLAEPSDDSVVSVYLTKPGKESTPPQTIELTADGEVIIRFCRIYAATEKPYAVVTETRATDGKVQIRETALMFEKGEWVPRKVSTVKRDVDDSP